MVTSVVLPMMGSECCRCSERVSWAGSAFGRPSTHTGSVRAPQPHSGRLRFLGGPTPDWPTAGGALGALLGSARVCAADRAGIQPCSKTPRGLVGGR
eukprot:6296146-Alexandrium_andersonii.AAC.1